MPTARARVLATKTVFFRNSYTQSLGLMFRKPRPRTMYVFVFRREMRSAFHSIDVFGKQ
jgi:hypothetical protein